MILEYWKNNPEYWIAIKNKEKVDEEITYLFYDKDPEKWIEKVIYLDQFSRHFQRHLSLDESFVLESRKEAVKIVKENEEELLSLDEIELLFSMMPLKHLHDYDYIFRKIHEWLKGKKIKDFYYLSKFYYDTYQKSYNQEKIKRDILIFNEDRKFNEKEICEFYSEGYLSYGKPLGGYLSYGKPLGGYLQKNSFNVDLKLEEIKDPIISLSGGVDSMILLYYYQKVTRCNPIAVHIVYGNRKESDDELNFIGKYCKNLGVQLYTYCIEWLKREEVEREFYEKMTRDIRFMVYRCIRKDVILGHIKDDLIENIWTNIATCKHLDNLKKMEKVTIENEIRIHRPLLEIDKKEIFKIAYEVGIPYLKNTTPSWSNRGKYREHFYQAVQQQYGENVDNNIINFAENVSEGMKMINKLLYQPVINSFDGDSFDISLPITNEISFSHWDILLEKIFHQFLKCGKPSRDSVKNFYSRIQRFKIDDKKEIKIKLKRDITFKIHKEDEKFRMIIF